MIANAFVMQSVDHHAPRAGAGHQPAPTVRASRVLEVIR
jgi:hypothetical protein